MKGMRYCVGGKHQVCVEDCRAENGELRANCRTCLNRRTQLRQQAAAAAVDELLFAVDDPFQAAAGDDRAEGVEAPPLQVVDEFDAVFGDGADLMDIDLPSDSAVSAREAALLKKLNEKIDAIKLETCDICWEEGFDLNTKDGVCGACRRDTGDPVKKWSSANKVHPCACTYSTNCLMR